MQSNNELLSTAGRVLFALPFGIIGINHFIVSDFFNGMLTTFIPGGGFMILFTGACLIAASISIILKKYIKLSCLLLALLLLIFILTIHIPQLFEPDKAQFAFMELLKDTALMGGALIIAGIYKEDIIEYKKS
ncbi:MAG: DoxX family protein [Bacteroidales bacterium]|nr:MAG: DoxX family protein [Bacteroidales bacterium]